jgi:hypothetical protein
MPMAGKLGTSFGTMPCPKCGQPVPCRPGTYGHVIAECPVCLNTLVAVNSLVRPATGGGAHPGGAY